MELIYVILWKYSDNSAGGIVRAYASQQAAARAAQLLAEHGDTMKLFTVESVMCSND